MKSSLTKPQKSQVWSKHQTHLKNNPLEKGEMEGLTKKAKGLKAAQWLLQTEGKKYLHVSKQVEAKEAMTKKNQWVSEKKMLDSFDWEELQLHIASGRVVYREDTVTPNVWQYKDTQDYSNEVVVARGSKWQQGMELEPGETHQEHFSKLYHQEAMGLGLEDIAGGPKGKKVLEKAKATTREKTKALERAQVCWHSRTRRKRRRRRRMEEQRKKSTRRL